MTHAESTSDIDLSVDLAGIRLSNPMLTASGTCGYGMEYAPYVDLGKLGAFTTKSITVEERKGNQPQRIAETSAGMLNAIGLANIGLERFCNEKIDDLQALGIPVFVNVAGHSIEDYLTVCRRLDPIECISALELNVSCPNVSDGLDFGTDAARLERLVAAVRREVRQSKLIVKLSPNVTDITEPARAAIAAGADVLSMVNTFVGMAIDVETQSPVLANVRGGLSGPAIKPMAVYMVHRVYSEVANKAGVPIIGMGGIHTWQDAVEFLLAGASALAVGTALFVDPTIPLKIADQLKRYMQERRLTSLQKLVGQLKK